MQSLHRNNGGKSECAFFCEFAKPSLINTDCCFPRLRSFVRWLKGDYETKLTSRQLYHKFSMFVSTNRSRPVAPSKYLGWGFSFKLRHNKPKTISRLFFILQPPWSFLDFSDIYWKVSRATLQEEFYKSRAEVGPCNPTLRGWMEFSSTKRCLGLVRIDSSCGFSLHFFEPAQVKTVMSFP